MENTCIDPIISSLAAVPSCRHNKLIFVTAPVIEVLVPEAMHKLVGAVDVYFPNSLVKVTPPC